MILCIKNKRGLNSMEKFIIQSSASTVRSREWHYDCISQNRVEVLILKRPSSYYVEWDCTFCGYPHYINNNNFYAEMGPIILTYWKFKREPPRDMLMTGHLRGLTLLEAKEAAELIFDTLTKILNGVQNDNTKR